MGALNTIQQILCIFEIILKSKVKKKTRKNQGRGERGEVTRERRQAKAEALKQRRQAEREGLGG